MNDSVSCLTPQRLRQLSENELTPPQLEELEEHVTHCESCRCALEQGAAEPAWQEEVRDALLDATGPQGWSALADFSTDDVPPDAGGAVEQFLKLLGPTDDPRMLGRIGAYEIIGILGRGGMGVVFKGFDGALNRYVAIKMLLPHLAASGAARKRFAREAQAAAAVVHDHVMAIHSVAEWQGVPYLVMPYGRGVSLQRRLSNNGPLEVREILRIGMQTAAGLAAAHAQGLVHRDVKPANILLAEDVERVTLTDFGLARAVDDASLTRTGTLAGTPQYMSPEQACGKTVDARSDLFSLGSVLYAMCTGRSPFRAESSYGVLRLITDDEPTPIREINPEIPAWLCAIVSRLMAKSPEDRFSSAGEVAELLEGCLAHVQQPTSVALPNSLSEPRGVSTFSFCKKIFLGVLVMVATLALGLWAIFVWQGESPPNNSDETLEGVWELHSPNMLEKRPEDQRLRLVFAGDWHVTFRGSQLISAFRLKVESQQEPKRLSLTGAEGTSMRGIYEIKGGGLRLSLASDTSAMPTKFGTEYPEFRRVKGKLAQDQLDALKLHSKKAVATVAGKSNDAEKPAAGTAAGDVALQGVWDLALPPEIAAKRPEDERLRLVFAGDWFATFRGPQRISESRFMAASQLQPKQISFVDKITFGEVEGRSMRGIYEVKDDGLRLCLAVDTLALPTKFGTELPEFVRVKGKLADEQLDALKVYSKEAATTDQAREKANAFLERTGALSSDPSKPKQARKTPSSPRFDDRVFVYGEEPISSAILEHDLDAKEVAIGVGLKDGIHFGSSFNIWMPDSKKPVGIAKVIEVTGRRCVAKVVSMDQDKAAQSMKGFRAVCTAPKPSATKLVVEMGWGKNVWLTQSLEDKIIREVLEIGGDQIQVLIRQEEQKQYTPQASSQESTLSFHAPEGSLAQAELVRDISTYARNLEFPKITIKPAQESDALREEVNELRKEIQKLRDTLKK